MAKRVAVFLCICACTVALFLARITSIVLVCLVLDCGFPIISPVLPALTNHNSDCSDDQQYPLTRELKCYRETPNLCDEEKYKSYCCLGVDLSPSVPSYFYFCEEKNVKKVKMRKKKNNNCKIKTEILCLHINIAKGTHVFLKYANILGMPSCFGCTAFIHSEIERNYFFFVARHF